MERIFVSSSPKLGVIYTVSHPKNLWQRVRVRLAALLIEVGLRLQLGNGESRYSTSSSDGGAYLKRYHVWT